MRSIDDEVRANRKLNYKGSEAFIRLDKILDSRHQPWCRYGEGSWPADEPPEPFEDAEVRLTIHQLAKEELPRALARACVHGDLRIAKSIWAARGPFDVDFKKDVFWTNINGTRVSLETEANHIFTNATSSKDIQALMEWMPTVGLGFMIGSGSEHAVLFDSMQLENPVNTLSRAVSFDGVLPSLTQGVLSNPELVIALQDKARNSAFASGYENILCWVADDMLSGFGDSLRPYEITHGLVVGRDEEEDLVTQKVGLREASETLLGNLQSFYLANGEVQRSPGEYELLEISVKTSPCEGSGTHVMDMCLGHLSSPLVQHGFWDKPGYTLCMTKPSFLAQFEQGPVEVENLQLSLAFADQYFPLDIIAHCHDLDRLSGSCLREDIGLDLNFGYWRKGLRGADIERFYCAFGDVSPVHERLREAVSKDLVEFVLQHQSSRNVTAEAMIALQQAFGIDNRGLGMAPNHHDLQKLCDAGFKFSSMTTVVQPNRKINGRLTNNQREGSKDTTLFLSIYGTRVEVERCHPSESDLKALDESYRNAIRLGIWPSDKQSLRPKTVSGALTMLAALKKISSNNHDQALLAYLEVAGVEECAKGAKAGEHWQILKDHFGDDAMRPLLGLASRAVRGKVLEDDLGM